TTDLKSVWPHGNTLDLHLGHSPGARPRRSHDFAFSGVLEPVVLEKAADEDGLALELSLELPFWAFAPASCSQEHADGDDCGDSHHRLIFFCQKTSKEPRIYPEIMGLRPLAALTYRRRSGYS